MLAVAAAIGAQARVPAMVLMRAPLGERGSYLPTAINVVQCLGWTVFELLVIATRRGGVRLRGAVGVNAYVRRGSTGDGATRGASASSGR